MSQDYLTHLNYSITLFSNDEIERARKQFQKFDSIMKKQNEEMLDVVWHLSLFIIIHYGTQDSDVKIQADLMRKALGL